MLNMFWVLSPENESVYLFVFGSRGNDSATGCKDRPHEKCRFQLASHHSYTVKYLFPDWVHFLFAHRR